MIPDNVKNLLDERHLEVRQIFRDGPRYWVARLSGKDGEWIIKSVFNDTPWTSSRTGNTLTHSFQLQQEALVFKTLAGNEGKVETDPHGQWFVRPYVASKDMTAGPSPFIFKEEFFEPKNYRPLLDYIEHYQGLTPKIRPALEANPLSTEHDLEAKLFAIAYQNPSEILAPYAEAAHAYLNKLHSVHDRSMDCLSHGQMYPPHILISDGVVEVIDWESASLNHRLADYTALWIRGFDHPRWQNELLDELHERGAFDFPHSQQLWDIEILLGSSGNLNYLHWSDLEDDTVKAKAIPALKQNIEKILGEN